MSNFERYDEPVATNESHNLNINPDVFRQAGTMEVNTHNDGEVRNMQQRVDAHELPSPYGGNILSTLKTPQGSPILTQDRMSDSCIVTVNGMEMSVSQAKGLGFIQADAGGNLSETGRTAEDLNASETPSIELRDFSGESKEVMDSLTAGVGERTMHELTNSIIAGITSEDYNGKAVAPEIGLEKSVKSFTNLTGVDPEHAEKAVRVIVNSHVDLFCFRRNRKIR